MQEKKAEEVLKLLKERRSVRKYSSREVPAKYIEMLLEAASYAPSGGNKADWKIILVTNPETKKQLTKVSLNQEFIEEAPLVLVFCGGRLVDVSAAIENVLIMAHALGLEGCWIGAFDKNSVKKILGIPENTKVHYIVTIGFPEEKLTDPGKRFVEEIVYYEKWSESKLSKEALLKVIKYSLEKVKEFYNIRKEVLNKYGENSLHMYRLEEKYSAFIFASLAKRIVDISSEIKFEHPIINEIRAVLKEYSIQRGKYLGITKDINSPEVVALERKYSIKVFPKIFEKAYRALIQQS